jgi:RNA polymerase sigma-70 factor (ECF subfamily)
MSDSPLGACFVAVAGRSGAAVTMVEPLLRRALDGARAAWPGVEVPPADYVTHLARHAAPGGDPARCLDGLHLADLYLACALGRGDVRALEALEQQFLSQLPRWLAGQRATASFLEEVRQRVRVRVLVPEEGNPRVLSYGGRGPLAGWLRIVALRVADNLRRDEATPDAPLDDEVGPPPALPMLDPELAIIKRRHGEVFRDAFHDAFAALDPDERNLFRLFYLDGLNLDALAVVLQISRATAGRRMLAARRRILDETLALLGARLRVDAAELESLLGVVRSGLEISLRALLQEA